MQSVIVAVGGRQRQPIHKQDSSLSATARQHQQQHYRLDIEPDSYSLSSSAAAASFRKRKASRAALSALGAPNGVSKEENDTDSNTGGGRGPRSRKGQRAVGLQDTDRIFATGGDAGGVSNTTSDGAVLTLQQAALNSTAPHPWSTPSPPGVIVVGDLGGGTLWRSPTVVEEDKVPAPTTSRGKCVWHPHVTLQRYYGLPCCGEWRLEAESCWECEAAEQRHRRFHRDLQEHGDMGFLKATPVQTEAESGSSITFRSGSTERSRRRKRNKRKKAGRPDIPYGESDQDLGITTSTSTTVPTASLNKRSKSHRSLTRGRGSTRSLPRAASSHGMMTTTAMQSDSKRALTPPHQSGTAREGARRPTAAEAATTETPVSTTTTELSQTSRPLPAKQASWSPNKSPETAASSSAGGTARAASSAALWSSVDDDDDDPLLFLTRNPRLRRVAETTPKKPEKTEEKTEEPQPAVTSASNSPAVVAAPRVTHTLSAAVEEEKEPVPAMDEGAANGEVATATGARDKEDSVRHAKDVEKSDKVEEAKTVEGGEETKLEAPVHAISRVPRMEDGKNDSENPNRRKPADSKEHSSRSTADPNVKRSRAVKDRGIPSSLEADTIKKTKERLKEEEKEIKETEKGAASDVDSSPVLPSPSASEDGRLHNIDGTALTVVPAGNSVQVQDFTDKGRSRGKSIDEHEQPRDLMSSSESVQEAKTEEKFVGSNPAKPINSNSEGSPSPVSPTRDVGTGESTEHQSLGRKELPQEDLAAVKGTKSSKSGRSWGSSKSLASTSNSSTSSSQRGRKVFGLSVRQGSRRKKTKDQVEAAVEKAAAETEAESKTEQTTTDVPAAEEERRKAAEEEERQAGAAASKGKEESDDKATSETVADDEELETFATLKSSVSLRRVAVHPPEETPETIHEVQDEGVKAEEVTSADVEEEEEEEEQYDGQYNSLGQRHGRGVLIHLKTGHRYEGEFQHGKRHGRGSLTWPSPNTDPTASHTPDTIAAGGRYDGSFRNDMMEGRGCLTWPGNVKSYVGDFKENQPHGHGILTWMSDGRYYDGEFVAGQMHGFGTFELPLQKRQYVGFFANDKKHGQGTYSLGNGEVYEGCYVDDRKSGFGTYTWPDGSKYRGDWANGKANGEGVYTSVNGETFEGTFLNDQMHGTGVRTLRSGRKVTEEWREGKKVRKPLFASSRALSGQQETNGENEQKSDAPKKEESA